MDSIDHRQLSDALWKVFGRTSDRKRIDQRLERSRSSRWSHHKLRVQYGIWHCDIHMRRRRAMGRSDTELLPAWADMLLGRSLLQRWPHYLRLGRKPQSGHRGALRMHQWPQCWLWKCFHPVRLPVCIAYLVDILTGCSKVHGQKNHFVLETLKQHT